MFNYLKNALQRKIRKKIARRVTKEYPPKIDTFNLQIGTIEFANWDNPLVKPIKIDDNMIDFFKQFIKEGDLAIDIGANIGDTTVPIALCTGVTGLTLGFDPNPFPFKILEKNATLNKDKMKMVPLPYAISTEEEEFYYVSSEASFANGAITKITAGSKHGKFIYPNKVKGINLEKFLEQEYKDWLSKFSFVKIDAEGYDKEIIKSISNLISKYKPVIIAESFAASSNEEKTELYEVINKHGYDIFYFADFSIKAKVEKLNNSSDLIKYRETINIYTTPQK
jgi:FkbM family methyltransferase